jgi:hypothetical protein
MDVQAITTIAVGAGAVLTVVTNAFGILDKLISAGRWVGHKVRRGAGSNVPTKTLIALVHPRINALYWGDATLMGKPGMQVVGDFIVTNTSMTDALIPVGVLRYRRGIWRKRVRTSPLVKHLKSGYSGSYGIASGATSEVRMGFIFLEPDKPPPGDFVADVAFVDQFGNYHWLKGLRFKHPSKMHV